MKAGAAGARLWVMHGVTAIAIARPGAELMV